MQKLTTAQAYALQVKADRRAAARERASGAVRNDNARIEALFADSEVAAKPKVAKPVGNKVRKYAPWKTAEYQAIVDTYLRLAAGGDVVKDEVIAAHRSAYPRRSEGAVSFVVAHLRGLDVQHEGELTLTVAEGLLAAAYEADPERFPSGEAAVERRLEEALAA